MCSLVEKAPEDRRELVTIIVRRAEDAVPVADVLLADAREAMDPPPVSAELQKDPRDTARAVLLAAIASEEAILAPWERTTLVPAVFADESFAPTRATSRLQPPN